MDIHFNGIHLNPKGSSFKLTVDQSASLEQTALKYLWRSVILKGKDYVSLTLMARHTKLRYDQCETFITKLKVERKIPKLRIIEEMEG